MKTTDTLIQKIEEKAKIFKSRAIKSPNDLKRHDLIEGDEQKYMIRAQAELGWSFAKIGNVFNRDPRMVAKKVQQGLLVKDESKKEGDEASPLIDTTTVSPKTPEESSVCLVPPDDIDVLTIRRWGVPKRKAADILYNWGEYHREGRHEMCQVYPLLEEDMRIRKIPYKEAEILLTSGLVAVEYSPEKRSKWVELNRKYLSWEGNGSRRAFLKETELLD